MRKNLIAIVAIAVAAASLHPRAVSGQQPQGGVPDRPVTVLLVDSLGGADISAVLLRQRSGGDVVMLRARDADAGRVAAAVTMLVISGTDPSRPLARDTRIEVRGYRPPRRVPQAWLARSQALVARLRASPERDVPGAGRGRAQTVMASWLRPAHDEPSPEAK